MSEMPVELEALVGLHVLDGRGEYVATGGGYDKNEDALVTLLRLDGVVYCFAEDPQDGYRSCLGPVTVTDVHERLVAFPPMVVNARLRTFGRSEFSDGAFVLYLVNEQTGLVVMEVGTENIDDYYPSFLSHWTPEGYEPSWLLAPAARSTKTL